MEGNKKIMLGVVLVVLIGLAVWLNMPEGNSYTPGSLDETPPTQLGGDQAEPERRPSRDRDRDDSASRGNVEQLGGGDAASGPRDTARLGNKGSGGSKAKKPAAPIG